MNKKLFSFLMVGLVALALGITAYAQNVSVSTGGVVDVGPYSAVLQGTVSTDYYGSFRPPVAFIEYGQTENFGYTTIPRTFTSTQPIVRELVEGLSPNTQYYVRAVAQSASQGIQKGNTITFVTLKADGSPGDTGNNTGGGGSGGGNNSSGGSGNNTGSGGGGGVNVDISGSINNTNNGGTDGGDGTSGSQLIGGSFASKLFLDINDGFDTFTEQDILTYEIVANNITKDDLDEIYVVVEISEQVAYLGDNARGIYRPENHEVVFTLGDLDEKEGRKFQINVRPITELSTGDRIVMKALAVYTEPATLLQYQTIDYDVNTFNLEGAIVVTTETGEDRRSFPVFLILLIVVILIAIIVILGRKIYLKYKEEQEQDDQAEDLYGGLLQQGVQDSAQPAFQAGEPTKSVFDGMDEETVDLGAEPIGQPQVASFGQDKPIDPYGALNQSETNSGASSMQRYNNVSPPNNLPE